jgi:LAGLIDADG endonuclease
LLQIQSFFNGVGRIKFENKNNKVGYVVTKISDLTNVIIPHFKEYTLMSQNRADFMLFLSIIELMNKKQHLNKEGFINILKLKYNLNLGLRDELKQILVSESTSAKNEPTFFFFS